MNHFAAIASPINDIAAAMGNPFVAERGGVHDFPHPVEPNAVMRMPAHPIRDGGGPPPKNPAPALGADGPDLLAELGLDAAEIADLRAKGIV